MREANPKPTTDFVFRKLFGSEENTGLLLSLINSIVAPHLRLKSVEIKNPFNLAAYRGFKESIVDIKAQDQDETWYAIEMQVYKHKVYGKRAIYYAAKTYVDQLGAAKLYSALNTTIGIHFLAFNLFPDDKMVHQFVFKEMETNEASEELEFLQLYFVEMGKLRKDWAEIDTPRDRWVAFMTKGDELDRDALPAALREEPEIARAVAELERIGADPELREIYEAEEKARMMEVEALLYAAEEAMQEGMQQGREQGMHEGMQQGREQGMQEGMQQGREQGIHLGQLHLLHRLMTRHIGDVPPAIAARLDTLTPSELDELGEALFDLHTYAEVEAWLSRQ